MRILRRAGYPRRTPHKKSACAEGARGPGAQSRRMARPTASRSTPTSAGSTAPLAPTARRPAPAGPPPRPGTVLIRQSKDVTFEAPFILLLLGERRALLLDTGAVDGTTLRGTVDGLVADWLVHTNRARRVRPRRRAHPRPRRPRRGRRGLHRPPAHDRRRPRPRRRAPLGSPTGPRGRHARPRRPPARGLRHPRPPRGLDRRPRPDDRAAAHGDTVYPGSHLRRRTPPLSSTRSTGSSPSPRSAASSTCSAATSR